MKKWRVIVMLTDLIQGLSLLSSGALILVNKEVMSVYRFGFPCVLTLFHFTVSWVIFNFIECPPLVPVATRWGIGFLSAITTVSVAFSLLTNSIPFHQLASYLAILCGMVHRYSLQGLKLPRNTLWPLTFFFAGLIMCGLNDSQFTLRGALWAGIAAVLTTICQLQTEALARQFSLTFSQINSLISLPRVAFMLVGAVTAEASVVIRHEFQGGEITFLVASGFLVIVVECLSIWALNRTGSLGALIADTVRTIGVIGVGIALFPGAEQAADRSKWRIFGICVAVGGIAAYSIVDRKNVEMENRAKVAFREEEEQIEAPVALIVAGVEFEKAEIERDE
jgi:hypothetical protein